MLATSLTILRFQRNFHKPGLLRSIFMLGAVLAHPPASTAQADSAALVRPADVVMVGAGGAAFLAPRVLDINRRPPACAPCDRADVAWFDRWAIDVPAGVPAAGSTALIVALSAATWWDMARRPGGGRHVVASIQSVAWGVGATELAKVIIARKRPVLYTASAPDFAAELDNQRSLPSTHAATAFALATSYWLSSRERAPDWARWAALVAAASVGGLRIVSHRHFPSDVLAGAAVGVASAIVVHHIRF
jgi:membrane-associated phospholipid phosphatase